MALDTRDKRASAVHVGLPWRGLWPLPDVGGENQADRQHVAGYYRGILAIDLGAPVVFGDLTTLFSAYVQDLRDVAVAPPALDSMVLLRNDLATAIAMGGHNEDDANTMYAYYLSP